MDKSGIKKCYCCGTEVKLSEFCFWVKPKRYSNRYYCEKCAKEGGYRGSTGKRN